MSGSWERRSVDLEGFAHANPIPAASRIGPFLFSGALTGRDPGTREMPEGLGAQCANVFRHLRAVLEAAGGGPEHVIKLNVQLLDFEDREDLNRHWLELFPDPGSRPARQVVAATRLGGGALIHADLVAVLPA